MELAHLVSTVVGGTKGCEWTGVVVAQTDEIRAIRLDGAPSARAICVYDTAEPQNPAHGELCATTVALDDGSANELRAELMRVFNASTVIAPASIRNGEVETSVQSIRANA